MNKINAVLIVFTVLIFSTCKKQTPAISDQLPPPETAAAPVKDPEVNDTIRFLENRIRQDPGDFIAHNKLAEQYLQRLRETGDLVFLELAARAVRASLGVLPAEQNKGALALLAQVEFSSHNFPAARDHALRLIELEPNKGYPFQILGDALLELGNYDEAKTAFEQMEKLGLSHPLARSAAETRWARLAWLSGDLRKARQHYSIALKIVSVLPQPPPENLAWCHWQLGETAFAEGDYKTAEKHYLDALKAFPKHAPTLASLGRVRAAAGDLPGGIEYAEQAVRLLPKPEFVAALGDLYQLAGRPDEAGKQYELVEQIGRLSASGGNVYNRSLALFYADHDLNPEKAYQLAAAEYETRRDIYGADVLAWTALKAGRLDEAQTAITAALRLGTRDARLFYHAGMIAAAAGDAANARKYLKESLALNPQFDPLQAVNARNMLMKY